MGAGLASLPPAWGYPLGVREGVGGVGGGLDGMDEAIEASESIISWPFMKPISKSNILLLYDRILRIDHI